MAAGQSFPMIVDAEDQFGNLDTELQRHGDDHGAEHHRRHDDCQCDRGVATFSTW